jgi:hypothetical protein
VVVFSESELVTLRDGQEIPNDMSALAQSWGDAPRTGSRPFRRLGSGGVGAAPAVLALLFFALAGILLLWAGVSSENWWFAAAGGLLVVIGVGAAGVLIS